MIDWKEAVCLEWRRRHERREPQSFFPLIYQSFDEREILAAVETLLDGRITMGEQVEKFEARFAEYLGAEYAVMVNSGSSANLLAIAAISNAARNKKLNPGDEVLVPAVAWSTSVWPLIQNGLKPVFVDVDPNTMNLDTEDLIRKITDRTRALMAVHVLGNSAPMNEIIQIVRDHDLLLIEDTCESLGARFNGRYLGSIGDFGCYSFYYSHHITTGEGGMVVCHTQEDYDLLRCLRAHGWSRALSNRATVESKNSGIDPRFLFVNIGYNLRPMEVQAAFGNCQIERLESMNVTRNRNRVRLIDALISHPMWKGQMSFPQATKGTEPAWFGLALVLDAKLATHYRGYLEYLSTNGIENRPIISGNFIRQPALGLLGFKERPEEYPGAEVIHHRGFFLGAQTVDLDQATIAQVADVMLGYQFGEDGK